jgi:hypothetical protein
MRPASEFSKQELLAHIIFKQINKFLTISKGDTRRSLFLLIKQLENARATLKPFEVNARATCWPILGPAPRMRMTGDVLGMVLNLWGSEREIEWGLILGTRTIYTVIYCRLWLPFSAY